MLSWEPNHCLNVEACSRVTAYDNDGVTWAPNEAQHNMSRPIRIFNGSLIGFSQLNIIGKAIRFLSNDSSKKGFSHIGIAVIARPSDVVRMICESAEGGGLATRDKKYTIEQLEIMREVYPYLWASDGNKSELKDWVNSTLASQDETPDVFCLEACGTPGEVFRGLGPRVKITPLTKVVDNYNGGVCVRSLHEPLASDQLRVAIVRNLGISYEKSLKQLFNSVTGGNTEEDGSSWFCSELAAHIYKQTNVFADGKLANNTIPKDFSSASETDLLRGKATDEMWVKISDPATFEDVDT
ncbi:MAG: hypothetical protein LBF72_02940 [Holosporales bacterium]|nr:hypothetical protein [Holosporales bacterium]